MQNACLNPHYYPIGLHMVKEALQTHKSRRFAENAAMHAHRHHLRAIQAVRIALAVQHIEGVAQVGEKVVGRVETLRCDEAHVVGVSV